MKVTSFSTLAWAIALGSGLLSAGTSAHAEAVAGNKAVEVVFVLDTTGSMASLIEGAKRKIWSIATTIVDQNPQAEVRMGLVAYRDVGDDYVTKSFALTKDIQSLYGDLLALQAGGGGDTPESVNEALDVAVGQSAWSQDARTDRIIFLVGDAPPHMDYKHDRKYPETLSQARKQGIIVNAVQAGNSSQTRTVWRSIAEMGQGRYIPIPQDGGKVRVVETPYDKEIVKLQIEINGTVMVYGSANRKAETDTKMRRAASAPASVASDMASYINKSGKNLGAGITGDGDLVSDFGNGRQKLEDLKESELPEPLQKLDDKARRATIEAQAEKRRGLTEQMAELVRKRDEFVAKANAETKAPKDAFDDVVSDALRAQIKR